MIMQELNIRELKQQARQRMKQAVPHYAWMTLAYLALTTGLSSALDVAMGGGAVTNLYYANFMPLFANLLLTLLGVVLAFGYKWWSLRLYRGQDTDWGNLIDGFSMAGRVVWMEVLILLRIVGWAMLGSIGIAMLMVPLSLLDSVGFVWLSVLLLVGVIVAFCIWLTYRYALAPYLLMDHPQQGASRAVVESVFRMKGFKWQMFKLDLSFLGWYLLNWIISMVVLYPFVGQALQELLPILGTLTDPQAAIMAVVNSNMVGNLLSTLATFPLLVWLMPYHSLATAGFYFQRSQMQDNEAPFSPWET